jgi:hypothetical protein
MAGTWTRVNSLLLLLVLWALVGVIAMLAGGVRGGPIDPQTPPGSTLPQVEPRNPIPPPGWDGTFPIRITETGSYFLTRNLTVTTDRWAIGVQAPSVTIDLNGFTLDGSSVASSGILADSAADLTVKNGSIRRFFAGVGAGPGAHIHDVHLIGNARGASISVGSLIEDCVIRDSAQDGVLTASTLTTSFTVRRCQFQGNATAIDSALGTRGLVAENNVVVPNNGTGIVVGSHSTVRGNTIVGETATYVAYHLGSTVNSAIIENRVQCNTGAGNNLDDYDPYDPNVALTNICLAASP